MPVWKYKLENNLECGSVIAKMFTSTILQPSVRASHGKWCHHATNFQVKLQYLKENSIINSAFTIVFLPKVMLSFLVWCQQWNLGFSLSLVSLIGGQGLTVGNLYLHWRFGNPNYSCLSSNAISTHKPLHSKDQVPMHGCKGYFRGKCSSLNISDRIRSTLQQHQMILFSPLHPFKCWNILLPDKILGIIF